MIVFFASKSACESAGEILRRAVGNDRVDIVHSGDTIAEVERQRVIDRLLASAADTPPFIICATSVRLIELERERSPSAE